MGAIEHLKWPTLPVQWRLNGGARLYEGRLQELTTGNLRALDPNGALPTKGDRLLLIVSGFPEPIPFKCVGVAASTDVQSGPVMRIELEIA